MPSKHATTVLSRALLLLSLPVVLVAAQLPPEIQADRYLMQAERAVNGQDFLGAKTAMDAVLELQEQHDLELPEQFSFRYAEVLDQLGLYDEAVQYVTEYLTVTGRDGKYYRDALELLNSAEETGRRLRIERELADAAQRQAEAEQQETDKLAQRQIDQARLPLPRDDLRSGGQAPEMVRIASGRFQYLTYQWEPFGPYHHWVEFEKPFAMSRYEVTRGEFEKFVDESDYRPATDRGGECLGPFHGFAGDRISVKWNSNRYQYLGDREDLRPTDAHPVFCVTIRDAMAYANWLSEETGHTYRLPSAAEWQYAARAGSMESMRAEYREPEERCGLGNMAQNTCNDGVEGIAPVGHFSPNSVGLHDMFGNLAEWVLACLREEPERVSIDGEPDDIESCTASHLAIGDSWDYAGHPQDPIFPATWSTWTEDYAQDTIGIRVVRQLTDEEAPQ